MWSVTVVKFKSKPIQRAETCEYIIDTSSDTNVMLSECSKHYIQTQNYRIR